MTDLSPPWVIAIISGLTVVGQKRPGNGEPYLEPVYQLARGLREVQGGMAVGCMATPVLMLASWKRMTLPPGSPTLALAEMSSGERQEIERAIKNAEGFLAEMRAQQSGLALVPPGAKLPPLGVK